MAKGNLSRRALYVWEQRSDFAKKSGIDCAVIFEVGREDDRPFGLPRAGYNDESDYRQVTDSNLYPLIAKVLRDGPLWDCMSAGTDFVVTTRLMTFLQDRVGKDLAFVPVTLIWKGTSRNQKGYHAVIFNRTVRTYLKVGQPDLDSVAESGYAALNHCDPDDGCLSKYFIDAGIAESMIEAGFTGLGFTNLYSSDIPGRIKARTRVFPEEAGSDPQDSDEPNEIARRIAVNSDSLRKGWEDLLASGATRARSRIWKSLLEIDVLADVRRHVEWLKSVIQREPPQSEVCAFWFGLFDQYDSQKSEALATLYVAGSEHYSDQIRYCGDWACKPEYVPKSRYAPSTVLNEISRKADKARSEGLRDELSYFLVLGYAALLMRFTWQRLPESIFVQFDGKTLPVAVGFDSGDFIFIGSVAKTGFHADNA